MQARIETQNPGEKLKKDMYVTATVQAGKIQNAIAVPDSAVLRDSENQPFVYAEVSSNQFGRRPVTVGESQQGKTQITAGLKVRRPGYRRRQPVSAVRELAAALAMIEEQKVSTTWSALLRNFVELALSSGAERSERSEGPAVPDGAERSGGTCFSQLDLRRLHSDIPCISGAAH